MDFWLLIEHIGWILIVIVGTFYAFRELQGFWYDHVEHRIEKGKLKTEASVEAIVAKITGAPKAVADGVADAVDGARNKLADGLQATADEVRPETDA